jgi:hypothetical protein
MLSSRVLVLVLLAVVAKADIQFPGYYRTELLAPSDCISPCPVYANGINDSGWVVGVTVWAGISSIAVLWQPTGLGIEHTNAQVAPDAFADEIYWLGIGVANNGDLLLFHGPSVGCSGYDSRYTVVHKGGGPPLDASDCAWLDAELLKDVSLWKEPIGGPFGQDESNARGQFIRTERDGTAYVFTPLANVPEPSSLGLLGTAALLSLAARPVKRRFVRRHAERSAP